MKKLKSTKYLDFMPANFSTTKIDVVTRWNSTFDMVESSFSHRAALESLYAKLDSKNKNKEKEELFLDDDDVKSMFDVMEQFLKVFKAVSGTTERLQTEQLPMSIKLKKYLMEILNL